MSVVGRVLGLVERWALSKNKPGGYCGEDDRRWAYVIETNGDAYLTRIMLPRVHLPLIGDFRPMLHHFHRPDADRHLHNHPWNWAVSLILSGSYDEVRLEPDESRLAGEEVREHRRVRWWNRLTDQDYHAVQKLHGDVWTLFVTGRRVQEWGFMVDGKHINWQEFLPKKES